MANNILQQANQKDPTTSYYNNFFNPTFDVSTNVDNTIVSFFQKMTGDSASASLLAGSVITTCAYNSIDPLSMIQELMTLSTGDLTSYVATLLNMGRETTSLLGTSNGSKTPTAYVDRTILP